MLINVLTIGNSYLCFKTVSKDKYIAPFGTVVYSSFLHRLAALYTRAALGKAKALFGRKRTLAAGAIVCMLFCYQGADYLFQYNNLMIPFDNAQNGFDQNNQNQKAKFLIFKKTESPCSPFSHSSINSSLLTETS